MHLFLLLSLSAAFGTGFSQVAGYGRCGGTGYTGETTCATGFYCNAFNSFYSQCIPGTGPVSSSTVAVPTSLKTDIGSSSTATTLSTIIVSSTSVSVTSLPETSPTSSGSSASTPGASSTVSAGSCSGTFTPVTASAAFAGLHPGWNLGNTLDATPDEGSWNNPAVQTTTLKQIQAKGFNSIRIPVTWAYHFSNASPSWTINSTWMDRVETVIDAALATGVYVILNVHHDSWVWADVTASGANITAIEERFTSLWYQIGTRFACKSSKLIFEALNEPVGTTQDHATELNKLNDIFLTQINNAGGFNPQRVVSLSGLGMDSIKTSEWFERGTLFPSQPWGIQFHYYSPYDFIFSAWGKTTWGSDNEKATLLNDFTLFNGNFSDVPAFVGEWDASPTNTESAARWKYFDYFIKTANSFKYSTVLWDNGIDHFDRSTNIWKDPVAIDVLFNAVKGVSNTLADSTTDGSATSQNSSATLFHKVGDSVTDKSLAYILNGNTLTGVKNSAGTALTSSQYSISSTGSLTLTAAYLGTLYDTTTAPGVKENLTLTFSAGAALTLQIVQYDTPTIADTTYTVDTSADLTIPITYKGLPIVAAVKALTNDGVYVVDDWTQYLGPLQQARLTYSNHFDWSSAGLIVKTGGLTAIQTTGKTVTLLVEFFPRSVGLNAVNITFTQ